ncbi:acyl-homoserine-lactone synthase [Oceanibium sediminis]|uniref:acyl-homoserine-lactone synthase n=1 Tax=Oceanibium sediminis TaxID=2026339 RepID=UPI000DD423E3|nr:acyl-homoserine-lactone synthase [Oceanibium sediminis]
MIRYLYANQLSQYPRLAETMFRDRASQFIDRLKWDLQTSAEGWELDEYDRMNPLYVILEGADGAHAASMRCLPSIGRTMVNDHFRHLNHGIAIRAPFIWECTRFCIAPGACSAAVNRAGALMLAGQELGLRFKLTRALGVYDASMIRIYHNIGWVPEFIGAEGEGHDRICLGLWAFSPELRDRVAEKAGLDPAIAAGWFDAAFPERQSVAVA